MSDITNRQRDNRTTGQQPRPRRRPHIDLGDTRSESFGEWLYGHRIGLLAVIVCFMLGSIFITTARVDVELRPIEYIVEFVEEEPTMEDIEKLKGWLKVRLDFDNLAVAQITSVETTDLFDRRAEFQVEMERLAKKKNYELVLLMLTDVLLDGSWLLFVGDEESIRNAFSVQPREGAVFLPHVMSRKKQIIPSLSALWG